MLCVEIERKRSEMLKFAKEYGLNAQATIQCSQELDKLLNLIQNTSPKKRKMR
ncbi:aspartyl-phosphate phosphatase Spo0E family protein [Halalkalibacter akibai]|uniref:Aspartyl-phosphate phosphatase Spo0E family protein n=1 Tax=Halalkalibacter akibai (strain ATCC 43226 / DSM 21942 / CIP 109018 / JCM 9157 / 1139) TaxID=1236973 RepID=W4QRC1_HALA3|nr:aspartyl-phosphate phosphatase Spo0E family protein [Halalkalibacter akibai]GAE34650.1 hypothetical protein JCM9157_1721 [Halalkalibacter akibai JCM 9157]